MPSQPKNKTCEHAKIHFYFGISNWYFGDFGSKSLAAAKIVVRTLFGLGAVNCTWQPSTT
jgi:hypothetical protein